MRLVGLRGRFVIAGVLLVATSAASSAWSAWAFRRVSLVVDATVQDSERTTAATAALATDLEREDDALLLTLTNETRGRRELADTRASVETALARVDSLLTLPSERELAQALRGEVDAYHATGDALVARAHDEGSRIRYHEYVNPLLRRAVADTAQIRDDTIGMTRRKVCAGPGLGSTSRARLSKRTVGRSSVGQDPMAEALASRLSSRWTAGRRSRQPQRTTRPQVRRRARHLSVSARTEVYRMEATPIRGVPGCP